MVVSIGKENKRVMKNRHGNLWEIVTDEKGRFKKFLSKKRIGKRLV